jgi:hypothetical protein
VTEPYFVEKPFPARVRWWQLWRHRWTVLNLLNQVAHSDTEMTVAAAQTYGGSVQFGRELYWAARDIIRVETK